MELKGALEDDTGTDFFAVQPSLGLIVTETLQRAHVTHQGVLQYFLVQKQWQFAEVAPNSSMAQMRWGTRGDLSPQIEIDPDPPPPPHTHL